MASAVLARFAEKLHTNLEQVRESNIPGRAPHSFKNLLRRSHVHNGITIGTT
jgi:hypothetical protein